MAGGAWFALRPLFARETLYIGYFRASDGRDPSNDAMFSGAQFALDEAGGKAGRFKVVLVEAKPEYSKLPPVWIGTSEAIRDTADVPIARLRISLMDRYQEPVDGEVRILATYEDQGRAAAEWAKSRRFSSVFSVSDVHSSKGSGILDMFRYGFPESPSGYVEEASAATQWRDLVDRILLDTPDLLFYAGEEAPFGTAESLFKALRERGYSGTIAMGEKEPEVSFLALPCCVPEGTFLISPIGPPSKEFAARYEPATGRHAGPHGWVGYLAMKAALDVIERAGDGGTGEFQAIVDRMPPVRRSCYLYCARNGKFEFVQELK
jgi:hypothetical protein